MKLTRISSLVLPMICISIFGVKAQNNFTNTLFYSDSTNSPSATLGAVSWIEGHWEGKAFGGKTEEIWTPPMGGSMMCAFKLVVQDKVKFYELVTIVEENNTLLIR